MAVAELEIRGWGEGAPLICLHGLSGHGRRFAPLAGRLPGRRLIAPDLRGHGDSDWEPPWGTPAHVADLVAATEALGVERADWLGFSFGGRIAAAIAATHPELVARLVLLDPALTLPADVAAEEAAAELVDVAFESEDDAIEDRIEAGTLYSTPRALLERDAAEHLERGEDGLLRWRYSRAMSVAAFADMAGDPPPVAEVPTLLITGSKSWVPVDAARYRAALGDRLTVVELDAGHSVMWDRLDETAAAIRGFLER